MDAAVDARDGDWRPALADLRVHAVASHLALHRDPGKVNVNAAVHAGSPEVGIDGLADPAFDRAVDAADVQTAFADPAHPDGDFAVDAGDVGKGGGLSEVDAAVDAADFGLALDLGDIDRAVDAAHGQINPRRQLQVHTVMDVAVARPLALFFIFAADGQMVGRNINGDLVVFEVFAVARGALDINFGGRAAGRFDGDRAVDAGDSDARARIELISLPDFVLLVGAGARSSRSS